MDAASTELLKNGILGLLLLLAITAIVKLWSDAKDTAKQLQDLNNLRVTEHQAMTAQLLKTTEQCVACLTNVANGSESQKEALAGVEHAIDSMKELLLKQRG